MRHPIALVGVALALAVASTCLCSRADAQVIREEGTGSVAGVLGRAGGGIYDDFTFVASDAVLFASLDGLVYQTRGRGEDEHANEPGAASAEAEGGDCADGGPAGFCLQVLDSTGAVLCFAERPRFPGWQRDPRLACVLNGAASAFTLRVTRADENCGDLQYAEADASGVGEMPYVLSVSLRRPVSGGTLPVGIGTSRNQL